MRESLGQTEELSLSNLNPADRVDNHFLDLIDEEELAPLLGGGKKPLSVRTVQQWRVRGTGPPFLKIGRLIRYDRACVLQWARAQMRQSTSETSASNE